MHHILSFTLFISPSLHSYDLSNSLSGHLLKAYVTWRNMSTSYENLFPDKKENNANQTSTSNSNTIKPVPVRDIDNEFSTSEQLSELPYSSHRPRVRRKPPNLWVSDSDDTLVFSDLIRRLESET